MLETVLGWLGSYQSEHPNDGLNLTVTLPLEDRTEVLLMGGHPKKSIVINLENDKILGTIYLWDTGELDTELVDMTKDVSLPIEECLEYHSVQLPDTLQVIVSSRHISGQN